jgi:hypothetical protein
VAVRGHGLRCSHCGGQRFHRRAARLDRLAGGGLFHLEGWWGHEAAIYACAACGFAHLFMPVPGGGRDAGCDPPGGRPGD